MKCDPSIEELKNLKEWLYKIFYLPHDIEDHALASFFRCCKGSLERTKNFIDKFYEGCIKYPEILKDFNPLSPATQLDMDISIKLPLPKKTEDGCVIIVAKIKDVPINNYVPTEIFRMYAIIFKTLVMDNQLGSGRVVFIADCQHLKFDHVKKLTPNLAVTVISIIMTIFPCRIAAMHAIGMPQAASWIINLGKNILKAKIAERIHVHEKPEELLKWYPKEIMPAEFGGEMLSLEKLQEEYRKKLESYAPRFIAEEMQLRKLDVLRPKTDDVKVGSFRYLEVD